MREALESDVFRPRDARGGVVKPRYKVKPHRLESKLPWYEKALAFKLFVASEEMGVAVAELPLKVWRDGSCAKMIGEGRSPSGRRRQLKTLLQWRALWWERCIGGGGARWW